MAAVTLTDGAWLGAIAAVIACALAAVWVTRRRKQWPDRLTFMGGGTPRRTPELVHVLGPGESPASREAQPAPRIDPDRRYVFGEYEPDATDRSRAARQSTSWALRQSTRRRRMARGSVAVLLAAAIALTVLALIGSSVRHHPHSPPVHHGLGHPASTRLPGA